MIVVFSTILENVYDKQVVILLEFWVIVYFTIFIM